MEADAAAELPDVILLQQRSVDEAFQSGRVVNVTVIRRGERDWYFTFQFPNPATQELQTYTQGTARKKRRTWSDPRRLFGHLEHRHGVRSGAFQLLDEEKPNANHQGHEPPDGPGAGSGRRRRAVR